MLSVVFGSVGCAFVFILFGSLCRVCVPVVCLFMLCVLFGCLFVVCVCVWCCACCVGCVSVWFYECWLAGSLFGCFFVRCLWVVVWLCVLFLCFVVGLVCVDVCSSVCSCCVSLFHVFVSGVCLFC